MAQVGYCSCIRTPFVAAPWESASFPRKVRQKQEDEADTFAAHFLMPEGELQKLKGKGFKELAEYFGVPEEKMELRLTVFDASKKNDAP
ncbi:ImmA/IrrE family metallo-endopeptidase [Dehalococcoides mccartyi]|uniref:ImmA/IrrE family metallo-endopeptidase n=1 Tax=Dehalococcoides mccartyi TaxID=61435 RepID=A0AB38Z7Y6_9CHLR|nr:ImmA/IrrE family metallo-endopeptidase [Dehalococcoides mccartyi]WRO06693.1 ImmA/IrrE family metallo-endopeptidase [Dehalococcoides mccartyi]